MKDKATNNPTHEVFHVVGESEAARWTKIGIGWSHKDIAGLNLVINYTPLIEGRTVVRKIKAKAENAAAS